MAVISDNYEASSLRDSHPVRRLAVRFRVTIVLQSLKWTRDRSNVLRVRLFTKRPHIIDI